ncbi:DRAP deaminase [Trichodelitschia bisporula]|uniref:Pseudouridine synthase n=1 Tax=Trichodelitschia bisporula TaxID=703511 RepID=A0A6G1HLH8_9PEZI|nr:DRAP deaminase [Trichodelitschia bisporula]
MSLVPVPPRTVTPIKTTPKLTPPPPVITTPCDPLPDPYYIGDGLRRVKPYHFTYNTHCKERWRGRTLVDIFAEEFRDRSQEYYADSISRGLIVINGKVATPATVIKNGDVISHTLHRHEPPITASPIAIVHEDADLLVINKPASIPVHPAGRYNHNSVVEILRSQYANAFNPSPCNRLDRLTSGVMFIGKHRAASERVATEIRARTVRKEYVARVVGEFPEGEIVCEKPILQISPKLGLNRVRANGKTARTVFKRLAYYPPCEDGADGQPRDGPADLPWRALRGYSIVRCMPLTGRTHQIRVHLQFLGHPIANDPIYCNQRVFGPALAAGESGGEDDEDVITRLGRMGKEEVAEAVAYHDEIVDGYQKRRGEKMTGEKCDVCGTELYSDPAPHELGIYLHARKYADEAGRWAYETELPAWALPPPGVAGPTEPTPETDPLAVDLAALGVEVDGDTEATVKESKAATAAAAIV